LHLLWVKICSEGWPLGDEFFFGGSEVCKRVMFGV
jgi:hypothetical protein